jgi:hypothetical protein
MKATQGRSGSQAWTSEFGPVCCGRIVGMDGNRHPLVDFAGNPGDPVEARCLETVRLDGRASMGNLTVLLVFEHGDPARPIIVGVVQADLVGPAETHSLPAQAEESRHAVVDGRRVVLKGDDEVTLVCGRASITLTKDGRISLRGVEILSRASAANKIRGASVNIN